MIMHDFVNESMPTYSKELIAWLKAEQGKNTVFNELLRVIQVEFNACRKIALERGDTEYVKGQVQSLEWVLQLPSQITAAEEEQESAGTPTAKENE